ncbi:MAG: beta-lactamase family protein [Bacteroidales bacterium]|nr:beta-lactamase family protein [Bacteroidales bacterium]
MKKLSILLSLSFLLLLSSCGINNSAGLEKASPESMGMNSEKLSMVDGIINNAIAEGTVPGAVISVVRDGKLVYLKAYGNKSVIPDTVAMTTNTVFDLASVSKCVGTTLAFMQMVEKGKVRLSDSVAMYIPNYAPWINDTTGERVPVRIIHLLTHSSGVIPYINMNTFVAKYGEGCPDSLIKHIATETGRRFKPGTDYMYSCLNFITLQNILQNITGQKLCDYVQENVFDALGLKHTCYNPTGEILALCAPTTVQEDGLPLVGKVHDPIARRINLGNSGNAGVFSSAEDLAVIAAALMNGGEINGHRVLGDLTVEKMVTVPVEIAPHIGRALGWDNRSVAAGIKGDFFHPTRTICHTGYTGTSMVIDIDSKTAVILLTNRVHPYDVGSVTRLRALVSNVVAGSIEE